MIAYLIIGVVVLSTVVSAAKRLLDMKAMAPVIWPLLFVAGAIPAFVGYQVLNPGEPLSVQEVAAQKDVVELDVPEGHTILITARLTPEDKKDVTNTKTSYNLQIRGDGFMQAAAGTIKRKTASAGPDIEVLEGKGITESGKRRSGKWGEDLQDRVELKGHGLMSIEVSNWQGTAAQTLALEVVRAPPSKMAVWALIAVLCIFGIACEVKYGAERLASDLAFLGLWGLFLRDGVTPLDDFQQVGFALAPAALLGWGGVGGVAWAVLRYISSKEQAKEDAIRDAEEAARRAAEEADAPARRRRRRRDNGSSAGAAE